MLSSLWILSFLSLFLSLTPSKTTTTAAPTILIVPLSSNFTLTLNIGTPPLPFTLITDFGIDFPWVFSNNCTVPDDCHIYQNYDPTQSSTSAPNGTHFTYKYAAGEIRIAGSFQADILEISPNTPTAAGGDGVMQFAAVDTEHVPAFFPPTPGIDGPLGLAYPTSAYGNLSIVMNYYRANLIPYAIYAIWANWTSGQLHLGGTIPTAYVSPITYTPIRTSPFAPFHPNELFLWTSTLSDVLVNGVSTGVCTKAECLFFVDTAAGEMNLGDTVPAVHVNADCSNLGRLPTYTFVINDVKYPFLPEDYVIQTVNTTTGVMECSLGFGRSPTSSPLVFGTTWLRAYYTVFDIPNKRLGFARAVKTV